MVCSPITSNQLFTGTCEVNKVDVLASKRFTLTNWATLSPYAGLSTYLSHAHEKTEAVNLHDENVDGYQGNAGIVAQIYCVRLGAEYNLASVKTFSYKLGVSFKFGL